MSGNPQSSFPSPRGEWRKIIEPSQAMLDILNEVINYVKRPPLAISYATPFENLLKASLNNNALTIMKKWSAEDSPMFQSSTVENLSGYLV